jgi:hypothetical protein
VVGALSPDSPANSLDYRKQSKPCVQYEKTLRPEHKKYDYPGLTLSTSSASSFPETAFQPIHLNR